MDVRIIINKTKTFCTLTPTHFTQIITCCTFNWDNFVGERWGDVATTQGIHPWQLWD
jgi:hypothetical protein